MTSVVMTSVMPPPEAARRIVPITDWAPAQELLYLSGESSQSTWPRRMRSSGAVLQDLDRMAAAPPKPSRSTSLSRALPWRRKHIEEEESESLGKSRSHGSTASRSMMRRASVSVREGVRCFIRCASSPGGLVAVEVRPAVQQARPWPWQRLRRGASMYPSVPVMPVPGYAEYPPFIPRNTGAAARQAAATAYFNDHSTQGFGDGYGYYQLPGTYGRPPTPEPKPQQTQQRQPQPSPQPQQGWLMPSSRSGSSLADNESGIGIALTSVEMESIIPSSEADSDVDVEVAGDSVAKGNISKVDFIALLPAELCIQILAQLDAAALTTAARVSKAWRDAVANQHVWRESLLREKTSTYAMGGPVRPGAGLGIPAIKPGEDWRAVYKAMEEVERCWREGKARPVYLNGHSDSIYCLQFDEEKIITGSRDKTIRVWDMHTYECKLVIGPPELVNDPAMRLLYDEDGHPVHYVTPPETDVRPGPKPTKFANASTPLLMGFPMHHKASILCLQYDDEELVTGSSDATCIVYDVRAGYRPVRRLRHHTAPVLDLVFDEEHIVTCSKDISICVWERATGSLLRQLRGHTGPVNAVQMRGNTIVSCSGDFRVKLWNIDTGRCIRELTGHTKGLACSQFSDDGRYVASAGNDRVIRIWDANTGECLREMKPAHNGLVRSLHVDSVSGRLISGSYDTDIKVWDMDTGAAVLDFPRWHKSWVLSAKSDYRRIVSTGQEPKILIMDFGAGVEGIERLEAEKKTGRLGLPVGFGLEVGVEGGYI